METSVNNKCKAFTSLKQSKKLAEFLPLESADMYYFGIDDYPNSSKQYHEILIGKIDKDDIDEFGHIPCWSLASLLDNVLPKIINNETLFIATSAALWHISYKNIYTAIDDNLIDACVELIEKLHELKML